jgi:hypothetical protein
MKNRYPLLLLFSALILLSASSAFAQVQQAKHNSVKNSLFGVYTHLDINNIDAIITPTGPSFQNFQPNEGLEFPKGSGKVTIFYNSLWLGGIDPQNRVLFAGERYGISDFSPGPLADSYQKEYAFAWEKVWKITREQVEYHKLHYADADYMPPYDLLNWPAHGDVSIGQSEYLAPFIDHDGDGRYNPSAGDYPQIRGDMCVYFICNTENSPHDFSYPPGFRVEIRGMAYSFNCPVEEVFANSIFVHYDIYNKESFQLRDTYLGICDDFDIGTVNDDEVQVDVERNTVLASNRDNYDGDTTASKYGFSPPVQSLTILSGPLMDPDLSDNPSKNPDGSPICGLGINGMNFSDGMVDNERFGITSFYVRLYHTYIPVFEPFDPKYEAMVAPVNPDGNQVQYGGDGFHSSYGPACRFMFPGESDTLNWGTGCVPPNGEKNWTMSRAGLSDNDCPPVVTSMGPFTFKAGDKQELDVVYTATENINGNVDYTLKLAQRNAILARVYFNLNETACGDNILSNPGVTGSSRLKVYPNPAEGLIRLSFPAKSNRSVFRVLDATGRTVASGYLPADQTLDVSSLNTGYYQLELKVGQEYLRSGFIKK